jgi:hypothetical protein
VRTVSAAATSCGGATYGDEGRLVKALELPSPVFGGVGGAGAAPAAAAGRRGFGLDLRSCLLQRRARRVSDGCFGSTMVVGLG